MEPENFSPEKAEIDWMIRTVSHWLDRPENSAFRKAREGWIERLQSAYRKSCKSASPAELAEIDDFFWNISLTITLEAMAYGNKIQTPLEFALAARPFFKRGSYAPIKETCDELWDRVLSLHGNAESPLVQ